MPHPAHKPPTRFSRQDLVLGGLVGASMLVVTGMYAFTLRYQDFGTHAENTPRWSVVSDGLATRIGPLKSTLLDVKQKLTTITQAHKTQSAAVAALKAKLESGATLSASAAPAIKPKTP